MRWPRCSERGRAGNRKGTGDRKGDVGQDVELLGQPTSNHSADVHEWDKLTRRIRLRTERRVQKIDRRILLSMRNIEVSIATNAEHEPHVPLVGGGVQISSGEVRLQVQHLGEFHADARGIDLLLPETNLINRRVTVDVHGSSSEHSRMTVTNENDLQGGPPLFVARAAAAATTGV